jgi:hypothetical protein
VRAENIDPSRTIAKGLDAGKLSFVLYGGKLKGRFSLVRMRGGKGRRENWLLIKGHDEHAKPGSANTPARPAVTPSRERKVGVMSLLNTAMAKTVPGMIAVEAGSFVVSQESVADAEIHGNAVLN